MAWRPTDRVESGELDNRVRGRVKGWIRIFGRVDPLILDLRGDCHPDLAGWRFRIVRLDPVPEWAGFVDLNGLSTDQVGDVGDLTADQLLRHYDCPVDELLARMRAGEPPPMELRKAFYMEWFSVRNGRVVIQDTRLGAERIGERGFELTEDDLRQQAEAARREIDELRQQGVIEEIDPDATMVNGDRDDRIDLQSNLDRQSRDIERVVQQSLEIRQPTVDDPQADHGERS